MTLKWWRILLAVWLVLYALMALTNLELVAAVYAMGAIAFATAVTLIIDR